jgi:hypothetical protein
MSTVSVTNLKHESASGNNITLDSSNRVGIGTGSPTQKLHVESAGTNYIVSRDSTSGGIAGVICQNGSDTRGIRINNANLELYDFSAALARVVVDSAGRVTMPYQPAFLASATGTSNYTSVSSNTPFPANTAYLNRGNHYNTSTYRFTAPVAGVYIFTWAALKNSNQSSRPQIHVNGGSTHPNGFRPISGNDTTGVSNGVYTMLVFLNASDYADLRSDSGSLYFYGDKHNGFAGVLIG